MRLARFMAGGKERVGSVADGHLTELGGSWAEVLGNVTDRSALAAQVPSGGRWPVQECELLAPLDPTGRGVFCIGLNYKEHADEVGQELGDRPAGVGFRRQPPEYLHPGDVLRAEIEHLGSLRHAVS